MDGLIEPGSEPLCPPALSVSGCCRGEGLAAQSCKRRVIELTFKQTIFLGMLSPCFRERLVERSGLGKLLSADAFTAGFHNGNGRTSLRAAVDTE